MPSNNAQLILQVDAKIAAAQRALNQLAKSVDTDASSMEKSLNRVAASHDKVGKALNDNGRLRAGFQQLSFQIGDVTQGLAMGTKASTIFAQQSGQVIQALQVMGGEGNKFLQFLGGPWGIAISSAAVILGTLVPKLLEGGGATGALVEKLKEQERQSQLNDRANELFAKSIEGVTKAADDAEKAVEALRLAKKGEAAQTVESIEKALAEAEAIRETTRARLADARALYEIERRRASGPGQASELAALGLSRNFEVVEGLEQQLANADRQAERLRRSLANAVSAQTVAEEMRSAEEAANAFYDTYIDSISRAAGASKEAQAQLRAQIKQINAAREAELKRIRDVEKAKRDAERKEKSHEFGRQVSFDEAAKIARDAGFQVNSSYRSNAQQAALYNNPNVNRPGNPVARPGTSAHNGANGKWAVDIQIRPGVTPGTIKAAYAAQGVALSKVLKENGHYHVEGSRSQAAAAENKAQREAEQRIRRENAFEEQRDRLKQELLRAEGELLQGVDAQADFAVDLANAERKRRDKAIDNDVEEGKLTEAHADELKALNEAIAAQRRKAAEINRQVEHIRQQDEKQQQSFEYQLGDLRFADELARSQAERRRIQLDIVDLLYQQKEAHLRSLKAQLEAAQKYEEAARIQDQINHLPVERAQDRERATRGTQGPLESYFDKVPQTADEVNEAMQNLAVQGIDGAINSIIALSDGFESFRDTALNAIKQIIAELIRMQLIKLAMNLIGSAAGAPGLGGGGNGIGSLGGAPSFSGYVGIGSSIPGFASGGSMVLGGSGGVDSNMLSLNGRPLAKVTRGETMAIIPRMPRVSLPSNDNRASYHINVTAPNTGDARRDRQTATQQAAMIRQAIATANRKGYA